MSTHLQAVINAAADEADTLLEGALKPADARPLLHEWLESEHPALASAEREHVVAGVLALLEGEGFFPTAAPAEDADDTAEPDE